MDIAIDTRFRNDPGGRNMLVDLADLCSKTAARWCASFGVRDEIARARLEAAIADRFASRCEAEIGDVVALLDRLACESIAGWFALLGADATGRGFDRLRHRFLDANRDADLGDHFLDPEVDRAAMRGVLHIARIEPTPAMFYREMPRQTL